MYHFCRLIRLSNVLFIGVFQVMLRYFVVLPVLAKWNVSPMMTVGEFALLVIATMTLTAAGNAINDYFDVRCDAINRPDRQVVDRHVSRRATILIHVILTLVGVFCGLYLAFVYGKENYALFFVAIPIILWFYSTHFKKQMLVGNLVVAMMMAATALLVVSAEFAAIVSSGNVDVQSSPVCRYAWMSTSCYAFFAFICNLGREIIKDMEDVDGDSECGCRTLPIEMGQNNSKIVVVLLEVFMMIVFSIVYWLTGFMKHSTWHMDLYVVSLIFVPTLYVIYTVIKGKESADYHRASTVSKWVMFTGIFAMVACGYL